MNGSTYPCASTRPNPKFSALSLCLCFVFSQTRPAKLWRKFIVLENKPTHILVAKPRQRSLRQVCEICAVSKEHSRQSHRLVCANLCCRMLWHMKHIRIIVAKYISSTTIHEKNFTWWEVWHALSNNSMSGGI